MSCLLLFQVLSDDDIEADRDDLLAFCRNLIVR